MQKNIGITLYPTTRCDTGCSHCLDDCNMSNPRDFSPAMAQQIVDELEKENARLALFLTGQGEPLMNQNLPNILDVFSAYKNTYRIAMVTSGFTDKDELRRRNFEALLQRSYYDQIFVDHSFNLFHPSFPERLKNAIKMLVDAEHRRLLTVRMCVAGDNYDETWQSLWDSLADVTNELGLVYYRQIVGMDEDSRKEHFPYVTKLIKESGRFRDWAVDFESALIPQWHTIGYGSMKGPSLFVKAEAILLEKAGRASKTSLIAVDSFVCELFKNLDIGNSVPLTIDSEGNIYPACDCPMIIGKVGQDSIIELAKRKEKFSEKIWREILADKRMFELGTRNICRICESIVVKQNMF